MDQPEAVLSAAVTRLLDHPKMPAKLLSLSPAAAILEMPDRTVAALFTTRFGPAEAIGERLQRLVDDSAGVHLKLAIIGGPEAMREQLPRGASMFSRRVVQTFHLSGADTPTLWTGGGARVDSPLGEVLLAAGKGELPAADHASLAERVEKVEVTPQQRQDAAEHRQFIAGLNTRPRLTWALLVVLGLIFVLEEAWGGSDTVPTLVRMGGNTADTLPSEPWRLLSSAALHAGVAHMLVNGFVLVVLGGFMEKLLGPGRYVALLLVSAIGGSLASATLSSAAVAVGASGAIWGVLGAAAALAWRPGTLIPAAVVPALRRNAIVNLVINLSISFLPQVDIWAHLGGGLAGAALVLLGGLARGVKRPGDSAADQPTDDPRTSWWRWAPHVSAGLLAVSLAMAWTTQRPWQMGTDPSFVDHRLTDDLSITTPQLLGEPQPAEAEPGQQAWTIGDVFRDPLWFSVVVVPHRYDDATRAEWVELYAGDGPPPPAEAEPVSPWTRVPSQESPTFTVEYRYPNGVLTGYWIQLREHDVVSVEHVRWPEAGPRWEHALTRVHGSL